jgi:hypothetical protein
LILGAAFFFATLLICHFLTLSLGESLGLAGVGLLSVMAASSTLVLWESDAELKAQRQGLQKEVADLKVAAAEERAAQEAEEAARQTEEAVRPAERSASEVPSPAKQSVVSTPPRMKACPYCGEAILVHAVKCKHCGEIIDEKLRAKLAPRPQQRWNPGVAAVLSFFWPGLGQMYKGQVLNGFCWMFLVALGYLFCLVPGFFLHVICIFGAASGSE